MPQQLNGKKVAILVADGFEQIELTEPRKALEQAGAKTTLICSTKGKVKGWNKTNWGDEFDVDLPLNQARAENFDALFLPGGVMSPDKLRTQPEAVRLTQEFFRARKPVAAICHAPSLLVEADVVRGRTITSYPSIQTDLENAGAKWVDKDVVTDEGLVTSRKPEDIPTFCKKMIEEIATGVHTGPRA